MLHNFKKRIKDSNFKFLTKQKFKVPNFHIFKFVSCWIICHHVAVGQSGFSSQWDHAQSQIAGPTDFHLTVGNYQNATSNKIKFESSYNSKIFGYHPDNFLKLDSRFHHEKLNFEQNPQNGIFPIDTFLKSRTRRQATSNNQDTKIVVDRTKISSYRNDIILQKIPFEYVNYIVCQRNDVPEYQNAQFAWLQTRIVPAFCKPETVQLFQFIKKKIFRNYRRRHDNRNVALSMKYYFNLRLCYTDKSRNLAELRPKRCDSSLHEGTSPIFFALRGQKMAQLKLHIEFMQAGFRFGSNFVQGNNKLQRGSMIWQGRSNKQYGNSLIKRQYRILTINQMLMPAIEHAEYGLIKDLILLQEKGFSDKYVGRQVTNVYTFYTQSTSILNFVDAETEVVSEKLFELYKFTQQKYNIDPTYIAKTTGWFLTYWMQTSY